MKKISIFLSVCVLLLILISCSFASDIQEETNDSTSVPVLSTAYPPAFVPDITISESSSTEETEREIFIAVDISSSPYINDFEEFGLFSGAMRFVVDGIEEIHGDTATVYRIRILETYGWNPDIDSEKIYLLGYRGTPKKPLWDRPPLQVGKEYLRLSPIDPDITLIQMSMVCPIEYTTAGKAYVYGYGFDFSELECAIPITDEKENQILKEGIHDKHIAYANENDIILPTFDYKCELNAMLKELGVND